MKRGFTLLEVLVALAVVAIGLSAAFAAIGQSARSAEQLRVRAFAQWAAADALTALRLGQQLPSGQTRRQEEISGRLWWVEYRVRPTAAASLRDVEVMVSAERNARSLASARGMVRLRELAGSEGAEEAAGAAAGAAAEAAGAAAGAAAEAGVAEAAAGAAAEAGAAGAAPAAAAER